MWSDKEATWLHQYNLVDSQEQVADGRPPKAGADPTLPNTDVDVHVAMWTKYLYSTYWAITTVTTIGYGDITPVTNAELIFVCVAELLGMFMFVYTTNSVSALLRGLDAKRTAFQEHLDRIQEYLLQPICAGSLSLCVSLSLCLSLPRCLSVSLSVAMSLCLYALLIDWPGQVHGSPEHPKRAAEAHREVLSLSLSLSLSLCVCVCVCVCVCAFRGILV